MARFARLAHPGVYVYQGRISVGFLASGGDGPSLWQQGEVPAYDTFSYAIGGQPVVNQNWLAQLAMYLLYRWGGFPLAQFVAGLCYAAAILIITRLASRSAAFQSPAAWTWIRSVVLE